MREKAQQLERSQLQPKALAISTSPEATEEGLTQLLGEPGATASWLSNVEEVDIVDCKFTGGLAAQVRMHLYSCCTSTSAGGVDTQGLVWSPCIDYWSRAVHADCFEASVCVVTA